ncbi:MAG: hypothetical protein LBS25_07150 [Candidatus Symbiothrix sp.]|nr:hypothetical protein [Candidatus Symbiothrix sp.]
MKRTTLLAITICMAISTFAEHRTIKDCSDNWLQRENASTSSSGLRGTPPTTGDDTEGEGSLPSVPIGGGITCLLLLASGYGLMRKKR